MNWLAKIKENRLVLRIRKSTAFARIWQRFQDPTPKYFADPAMDEYRDAEPVIMEWPAGLRKPKVGLVRDVDPYPRWTKYERFFQNNGFTYELFDINRSDWLEKAQQYDVIVGLFSNAPSRLDQIRKKIHFLEEYMHIPCYPASRHLQLYEDKKLESYFCNIYDFPFARTNVFYDLQEALAYSKTARYPLISKQDPSSGSMGVEKVDNEKQARRIIRQAFSQQGRKTHLLYLRQKDYVYFQEFVPNDGHDIRVVICGNYAYGYMRKVPQGDFRASGMNIIVHGHLPKEAVLIARKLYRALGSPMLAVDFVRGLDGSYTIIEFSPFYQVNKPSELHVNEEKGAYVFDSEDTYHHEKQLIWIHELALEQFFKNDFLPRAVIPTDCDRNPDRQHLEVLAERR